MNLRGFVRPCAVTRPAPTCAVGDLHADAPAVGASVGGRRVVAAPGAAAALVARVPAVMPTLLPATPRAPPPVNCAGGERCKSGVVSHVT